MGELGIRIEHLRKRYGEGDTAVDALKDVNMTVAPGEVVGLIGPSCSGKSTLLKCLGAVIEPSGGRMVLGGEAIYDDGWKIPDPRDRALLVRQHRAPDRHAFQRRGGRAAGPGAQAHVHGHETRSVASWRVRVRVLREPDPGAHGDGRLHHRPGELCSAGCAGGCMTEDLPCATPAYSLDHRATLRASERRVAAVELPFVLAHRSALDGQKRSNEDAPLTGLSAGGKLKHSIAS